MNALMNPQQVITMSSREIAELTGKRHDNVIRDIVDMVEKLYPTTAEYQAFKRGVLNFEGTYLSAQNKQMPCFNLPKDMTLTLISGYSVPLRHRIVTRWMELEEKQQPVALPRTFAEALRLAAEQQEKLEATQNTVSKG